jgi:hypothetical protein
MHTESAFFRPSHDHLEAFSARSSPNPPSEPPIRYPVSDGSLPAEPSRKITPTTML